MSRIERPATLAEALALLAQPDARPIAGGIGILLRKRLGGAPEVSSYVAVGELAELRAIRVDGGGTLALGAAVTLAELAASPAVRAGAPLLATAAAGAASLGIRSIATVGGNLVDGPADSDLAAAVLALGGQLEVAGRSGRRTIAPGTGLVHGEIVTAVRVPMRSPQQGWALSRLQTQGAADRPAVTVAVALGSSNRSVGDVRAAATFLADRPVSLDGLARVLSGMALTELIAGSFDEAIRVAAVAEVDRHLAAGALLHDDRRASATYRRAMVGVLAARGVRDALALAVPVAGERLA